LSLYGQAERFTSFTLKPALHLTSKSPHPPLKKGEMRGISRKPQNFVVICTFYTIVKIKPANANIVGIPHKYFTACSILNRGNTALINNPIMNTIITFMIKIIIGLGFIGTGINLFLIIIGYIRKGTAPIFSKPNLNPAQMVDPVPQALVLTAIVIDVAVLALALGLVIGLYKHYKTLNIRKIRGLKW